MINICELKKHYKGFNLNCSMKVEPGRITGLIGQNGAGKSTVFKAVLGLIREDGGCVEVFEKEARTLTKEDKRRIAAVLPGSSFSGELTPGDMILILKGLYPAFDRKEFTGLCEQFDLPLNQRIKAFSTGMKAKLKIAAALSVNADLLVLDEPTAGLDVIVRDEINAMLQQYMEKDENRSILISSNISSDLEIICDDIYMIHEGEIILHEYTDEILSSYGILKVNTKQFETMDQQAVLYYKKESFGYLCLTNDLRFYMENYPEIAVEKCHIDQLMLLMLRGEKR